MPNEERPTLSLKCDGDIAHQVKEIAEKEFRTVSSTLCMLVSKGIAAWKKEQEILKNANKRS